MKTLKAEAVNGTAYATIDHARHDIGQFNETAACSIDGRKRPTCRHQPNAPDRNQIVGVRI